MSVWNKILLGLIFLATLGAFHAALRTLKTYDYWARQTNKFETQLKEVNATNVKLQTADYEHPLDDGSLGVRQLQIDLGRVLANRGRIWKCERKAIGLDAGMTQVTVSTEDLVPNANCLVYAFEEG